MKGLRNWAHIWIETEDVYHLSGTSRKIYYLIDSHRGLFHLETVSDKVPLLSIKELIMSLAENGTFRDVIYIEDGAGAH